MGNDIRVTSVQLIVFTDSDFQYFIVVTDMFAHSAEAKPIKS